MSIGGSKPLHNFSFDGLRWGSQKFLKCMKLNTETTSRKESIQSDKSESFVFSDQGDGIQRQKSSDFLNKSQSGDLILRCLSQETDDLNLLNVQSGEDSGVVTVKQKMILDIETPDCRDLSADVGNLDLPVAMERPWNLRRRRASCKEPKNTPSEKNHRSKLFISLSKQEIDEDYYAFVGHRPLRKPHKRRHKSIQKQLDAVFPGLWLSDITKDLYSVSNS